MKEKVKEFILSSIAVDNATSVFLITFMILLFGIQSYNGIPKEQYPEASLPTVYINTPYFGNSAEEIENLISRPLEKELEGISNIKSVKSTSIQDFSVIIAEFNSDIDMEQAVRKVKDAVDVAKSELPNDLDQDPTVLEVNFSELPIVTVNISGQFSSDDLKRYAEYLDDKIEKIPEVNKVEIQGDREREVRIDVDMNRMQSLQVSLTDIEQAVGLENMTMSAGEITSDGFNRAVRVMGQFENIDELRNMIVKSEFQKPIYLREIADVAYTYKDRSSYSQADGNPVVSLNVIKKSGKNLLAAVDKIRETVEEAKIVLPSSLNVSYFNDQSVNTRNQVSNLENSIISGVILVVLVLLFFLGLRNAAFVGLAIPLSMLLGILILNLTGTTLNVVVLFSLILALGLLVDNAIVVVENIFRYMQEGYDGKRASKYGAGEVAIPIIASTATTLAAFIPLAFWPGIMGKFMQYMPITLIIVLISSLFVALVINPVFTAQFMKIDDTSLDLKTFFKKLKNVFLGIAVMLIIAILAHMSDTLWLRNIMGFGIGLSLLNLFVFYPGAAFFQNSVLPVLERVYYRFIKFALSGWKPVLFFLGTILLLVFAIGLLIVRSPKVEFFPNADPQYINIFVELPQGSDIKKTYDVVQYISDKVNSVLDGKEKAVEAVLTQIGENTADPNGPPEPGVTPHKARITIQFVKSEDRGGISSKEILNQLRDEIVGYPGVNIVVDQNANGPPAGKPINIELKGDNIDTLVALSSRVKRFINELSVAGIEEIKTDVNVGKPELLVHIDREAARRYQLSTVSIASAIRTSIYGKEISKYKQGEDEYPIILRLSPKYRDDIKKVMDQKVTFRNPANGRIVQVPISAVATFEYSSTYTSIKRNDGERVITLFSNVLDGYNANEIVNDLKFGFSDLTLPEGYSYAFTGEQQQQAEDMAFLSSAFLFALFMIFLIIVAQFNSLISPFIIVLSILFSTIGVFLGYSFTGKTISVIFSGVGIISLAGVVVNNAIVLIDYINVLRKRRREELTLPEGEELSDDDVRESIIRGGATRLRPVLLTAITTILGLIPLAMGINFNFTTLVTDLDPQYFAGGDNSAIWGPMAWTVIYGLTFATFLTLVVVPVMYWMALKSNRWLASKLFRRKS